MSTRSNWYKQALANHEFLDSTYPKPTVGAIALVTAAPDADDDGSTIAEPVSGITGYARRANNPGSDRWSLNTTTNKVTNDSDLVFNAMSATPSDVVFTHACYVDSTTTGAGNVKHFCELPAPITVNANSYIVTIPAGALEFTYN